MDLFGADELPQDTPQSMPDFPKLYGHQTKLDTLLQGLQTGQGPASLIVAGNHGIGKATFVRHLICHLLHVPYGAPVDGDDSQNPWENITHPDLLVVQRGMDDRKGERRTEILQDDVKPVAPFLRRTAAQGGFRVVVIDDASAITERAQNVLLKILEEPPANSLIILITHALGKLIRTIKSRCQVLELAALNAADMRACLADLGCDIPDEWQNIVLDMAGGAPGVAAKLLAEDAFSVAFDVLQAPNDRNGRYKLAENLSNAKNPQAILTVVQHVLFRLAEAQAADQSVLTPYIPYFIPAMRMQFENTKPQAFLAMHTQLSAHMRLCDFGNLDKKSLATGVVDILSGVNRA